MQPQGTMSPATKQMLAQELSRRAAGQFPSSAGVGAESTNAASAANPIPPTMQTNPKEISGGAAGTPSDGTIAATKQQRGEAEKLTDAMIFRMKKLTERGQ